MRVATAPPPIAPPAAIAGITVNAHGARPANTPTRKPTPQISSASANTEYSISSKVIMRRAISRGSRPEARRAQTLSATPPAPAVASNLLATVPAMLIW